MTNKLEKTTLKFTKWLKLFVS